MIPYNKIKYFSWKFIVFLFFVLVFGRGSSLVVNFDPRINPMGAVLYAMCVIYMLTHRKKAQVRRKSLLDILFVGALLTWTFLHLFVLDGSFPFVIYSQFWLHIFAGILIIKTYADDIGVYYEKALVLFSAISIICWGIETLGGYSLLLKFPFLMENNMGNGEYSIIFYTLGSEFSLFGSICRNSGCAWEPGLFSVMVNIALLFNISRNNGVKLNSSFILLLAALITTFSTTGYTVALIIFACHYIFLSRITLTRKLSYLCLLGTLFMYINQLPFMSEKIDSRSNFENFSTESGALEWYEKEQRLYTVDRFEGLYLDYKNFCDSPTFGYGLQRELSFVYKNISKYIITSNGLFKQFAQMGLILGILFMMLTYKSCLKLNKVYNFDASWILFVVIIVSSVSYMFDSTPIMRAIELCALYKFNEEIV